MATLLQRNRFRRELLPIPRIFYENAIGKLSKPSRGWARGRCPFHESKSGLSFSVNLDSGGFYCFGCQASGGDIVAFVQKRDGLSFRDAAKTLGCWDDGLQIDAVVIHHIETERKRREQERQAAREGERRYFKAESWLYAIESIFRDYSEELSEIRSGRMQSDQEEIYWKVLTLAQDEMREAEDEFIRLRREAGL